MKIKILVTLLSLPLIFTGCQAIKDLWEDNKEDVIDQVIEELEDLKSDTAEVTT